ncbi:MAG: hypothetical protein JWM18_1490 [Chloroflexi bacterium]|jgi:hypothetical protein|nr:hypothetical protein [Chloroflexota bacterium]
MWKMRGFATSPFGRRRVTGALSLLTLGLVVTGCAESDISAPYFATTPPGEVARVVTALPLTGGAQAAQVVSGPVSRPDHTLTPGVIAVHDVTAVCQLPRHSHLRIAVTDQRAVFKTYGLPYPQATGKYGLDYLVPIQLGGAPVRANLWPASSQKGVGFHQKAQLNAKLRVLVCQGKLSLPEVQKQIVSDWFALWVEYGTSVASVSTPPGPAGLSGQ